MLVYVLPVGPPRPRHRNIRTLPCLRGFLAGYVIGYKVLEGSATHLIITG